jgi:hypothetical protein
MAHSVRVDWYLAIVPRTPMMAIEDQTLRENAMTQEMSFPFSEYER